MSDARPTELRERIFTLDAIRGFALLGIFIMNFPTFNTSFFQGIDGTHLWPEWWDRSAETLRSVLFSGKFNSMFSMLFAIGFMIQLERLESREPARAKRIYLRRIGWLLVFGLIHAFVFWPGDVLHIYALFGLLLFALRRAPDKLLWLLFAACLVIPAATGIYRSLTMSPEQGQALVAYLNGWVASNNAAYGMGSFLDAVAENTGVMQLFYTYPPAALRSLEFYIQIFTTVILGLFLARGRFFQNAAGHLPLVRRVQWWALGLGLATGVVYGYWLATVTNPTEPTAFSTVARVAYSFCRVATMVFYVATIVRAAHSDRWKPWLAPIATAGRMPLTNYLMQTLIGTFLFYGWGLGFWGSVGPALGLVLAIGIFLLIQVPLSAFWLRRFKMGPMEYLWRVLTYGRASLASPAAHGEPAKQH
jgi:uncharacterized protein